VDKAEGAQIVIAMIGMPLCFLGFLRKPKESFELMAPRIAVPMLFLLSWYCDFFYWAFFGGEYQYEGRLLASGTKSLLFLTTCLIGFWIGFVLPYGSKIARRSTLLHTEIPLPETGLYLGSWIMAGAILGIALVFTGGAFIDQRRFSGNTLYGTHLRWIAVLVQLFMAVGGMLVGMAWPARGQWGRRAILFVLLLVIGSPNFAKFSRGAGLVFALAAVAFAIRHRRFNVVGLVGAAILCGVLANAGLTGRSIYGHYAGVVPFLEHASHTVLEGVENTPAMVFSAVGKWSVTSVVIDASYGNIHPSPWWKWTWFQVPLPRMVTAPLGLSPRGVGLSIKHEIGGIYSRGYTPSMFGDAWGHFGWMGFLAFIPIGIICRFVEALAIRPTVGGTATLNVGAMLVPTTYMALMLGFHNTYRAFVVAFFYPLYMLLILLVIGKIFQSRLVRMRSPPEYIR